MTRDKLYTAGLWACRIIVGLTFIVSGWAKCIDPWGFVFKISEYLTAWHLADYIPMELTVIGAVGLSLVELICGVSIVLGMLRRSMPIVALIMMAFMLPLTAYIYIANPVADCGCFGDLLILSNGATLLKNIFLTALIVVLVIYNRKARPLVRFYLQWLVGSLTGIYGITLALIGWNLQPVVDFRPFPTGSQLAAVEGSTAPAYIYSKDGVEKTFELDALPDSTWTFVSAARGVHNEASLAVFDGDYEVTDEVLSPEALQGDMLIIAINNPSIEYLTRARLANELSQAVTDRGGKAIGLVAATGETLQQWVELARPIFDVYSTGDTGLKQLVRGNAAAVAVRDGKILWKRSLSTIDPIAPIDSPMDAIEPVDDGKVAYWLTGAWIFGILFVIVLGLVFKSSSAKPRLEAETNKERE